MRAFDFETYEEYCMARHKAGLEVIPRSLFNFLKIVEAESVNITPEKKGA